MPQKWKGGRSAAGKRYRESHKSERSKYNHEWYIRNSVRIREQMSNYRKINRDKINADNSKWQYETRQKQRHSVFQGYGGECICCGETEELFMQVHHPNGDGKKDRNTQQFYKRIIDENYPPNYWLLCANCHLGVHRAKEGICPHKLKKNQC